MLYEVITVIARRLLGNVDELNTETAPQPTPAPNLRKMAIRGADGMLVTFANCRITSYNVCYTKLLRIR